MSRGGRLFVRGGRGLVLVVLLLTLLFTSVLALAGAQAWSNVVRREREAELLFVGDQYRQAIRRYYFAAPAGQARALPISLDELLEDHRFSVPVRHLRRAYPDPISGSLQWGLTLSGGRIAGVYSDSDLVPLKQTGFEPVDAAFEGRQAYRDWAFTFVPPTRRR